MSTSDGDDKGGVLPPVHEFEGFLSFPPRDRPDPSIAERHRRRDAVDDKDDIRAADWKMANDLQMPDFPEDHQEWWQNLSPAQRLEWEDAHLLWTRAFHNLRDLMIARAIRRGGRKSRRLPSVEALTRKFVLRDLDPATLSEEFRYLDGADPEGHLE